MAARGKLNKTFPERIGVGVQAQASKLQATHSLAEDAVSFLIDDDELAMPAADTRYTTARPAMAI